MAESLRARAARSLPAPREGQGLVEYGLVVVLVSIGSIAVLTLLGTSVSGLFTTIANAL